MERKEIIYSHYQVVVKMAQMYHKEGLNLDELINKGCKGLVEAVESYTNKNIKFMAYAVWHIRKSILN